jgi:hypothetical protein
MMREFFVVGERCPLGCLAAILVKRSRDGHVFAWCNTCGLAWAEPAKESWHLGDHGAAELHAYFVANGSKIELASRDDVERAGLKTIARRVAEMGDWPSRQIEKYNNEYVEGSDHRPQQPFSTRVQEMKIFQLIHTILILALIIGVPVAVSFRPDRQPFSISQSLIQGACVAGCIATLFIGNALVARIVNRRRAAPGTFPE